MGCIESNATAMQYVWDDDNQGEGKRQEPKGEYATGPFI